MKIMNLEEYLEYLDNSESAYFLEIAHSGYRTTYEIIKIVNSHFNAIFLSELKYEFKIWMDLNGFKICDKIIIAKNNDNKLDIDFESFELTRK